MTDLLFGDMGTHKDPESGIKQYGPYSRVSDTRVQVFFIFHSLHKDVAEKVLEYLMGGKREDEITRIMNIPFITQPGFSITFTNMEDPLPEIISRLNERRFDSQTQYVSFYLSPYSKGEKSHSKRPVYYRLKEELLHRGIVSQVLDANKIRRDNLARLLGPNMAVALYAKLGGIPWSINCIEPDELIIGVGAFRNGQDGERYVAGICSFSQLEHFSGFDCFRCNQVRELTGAILMAILRFRENQKMISRLVIHFCKTESWPELLSIEEGLQSLGLDIPYYVVSVNKMLLTDITEFEGERVNLTPPDCSYLQINPSQFLLYNNISQSGHQVDMKRASFPLKVSINRYPDVTLDRVTIETLLEQLSAFCRLNWTSMNEQQFPVTMLYPELLSQMYSYFERLELPEMGKRTLWFL
jgi:Piwi domain.